MSGDDSQWPSPLHCATLDRQERRASRVRVSLRPEENIMVEVALKPDHREKLSFRSEPVTHDSLSRVAARVNDVSSRIRGDSAKEEKVSYWQFIFLQSKVNGCSYRGEALPHAKWRWPKDTWFQEQLGHRLKALGLARHQARN